MRTLADYQNPIVQAIAWGSLGLCLVSGHLTLKHACTLRSKWFSMVTLVTVLVFSVSDLGLILAGNQLFEPEQQERMQVTLELLGVWLICLLSSYRVRVYLQANLSVNRQSYLLAGTAISAITMVLGIVCMVWLLVTTIIDPNYDDSLSDVRRTIIFFAGLMCLITNLVTAGTMFYKVFKIRQRVRNAPLSWTPPLLLLGSNHHLNNGHNNNNENCNGSSGNTVTTDGLHDAPTDAMIAKFNNRSISPMTSLAPKPIRSQQESIRHSSPHSATSPATAATAAAATRASRKPKLIRHVTLALILLGTQIALVIVGATLFASSTKPVPNLMAGALLRVYLLFSIILWRMVVGLYKL